MINECDQKDKKRTNFCLLLRVSFEAVLQCSIVQETLTLGAFIWRGLWDKFFQDFIQTKFKSTSSENNKRSNAGVVSEVIALERRKHVKYLAVSVAYLVDFRHDQVGWKLVVVHFTEFLEPDVELGILGREHSSKKKRNEINDRLLGDKRSPNPSLLRPTIHLLFLNWKMALTTLEMTSKSALIRGFFNGTSRTTAALTFGAGTNAVSEVVPIGEDEWEVVSV